MLLHLTYLKHMALYKMTVGKHRFQEGITFLHRRGDEQPQFSLQFEARKRNCTGGQPTPKVSGNANPHTKAIFDCFSTVKPHFW
jgi:hypothetical protein